MKSYLAIFRTRLSGGLQYRLAALAGVSTQFAWGFLRILLFTALQRANPAAFPMERAEMTDYIWLFQAFLVLFSTWNFENSIFNAITSGEIAYELARPMDLYNRWYWQNVAGRLSGALLRCLPILLVVLFLPKPYGLSLPPSLPQFLLFLLSGTLGLCVAVAFCMLVYIAVFFTLSVAGIRVIVAGSAGFWAGEFLPLPFFPPALRTVAELLPFAAVSNMPLRIYSGNLSGTQALQGILLQIFWLLVMVAFGKLWMRRALKRVVVQGG